MRGIRYALSCAMLFCAPIQSGAQETVAPTKSVQLSKVVLNPKIPRENQRVKVGTICLFAGRPLDFGSERTASYERFDRLFSAAMKVHGLNVVTKSADLFEDDSDKNRPDILVGATFTPQSVDICDSVDGLKGTIKLSVEWQIYDRAKRQVVETTTTEGSGQVVKFQMSGLEAMIDQAFSASVDALIAKGVLQRHLAGTAPAL